MKRGIRKSTRKERKVLEKNIVFGITIGTGTYLLIRCFIYIVVQMIVYEKYGTNFSEIELVLINCLSVIFGIICFLVFSWKYIFDYIKNETNVEVLRIRGKSTNSPYFDKNDGSAKAWQTEEKFYIILEQKRYEIDLDLWIELRNDSLITLSKSVRGKIIYDIGRYTG